MSLLGHAPSFFGENFHHMIIVAPSFSFPNVVKSCCLMLFSLRKTQKNKNKMWWLEYLLPHICTMEAL